MGIYGGQGKGKKNIRVGGNGKVGVGEGFNLFSYIEASLVSDGAKKDGRVG